MADFGCNDVQMLVGGLGKFTHDRVVFVIDLDRVTKGLLRHHFSGNGSNDSQYGLKLIN